MLRFLENLVGLAIDAVELLLREVAFLALFPGELLRADSQFLLETVNLDTVRNPRRRGILHRLRVRRAQELVRPGLGPVFYGYSSPGQIEEFWILDVDTPRLMIQANWFPESPSQDIAEMRAILDSIRIEP